MAFQLPCQGTKNKAVFKDLKLRETLPEQITLPLRKVQLQPDLNIYDGNKKTT